MLCPASNRGVDTKAPLHVYCTYTFFRGDSRIFIYLSIISLDLTDYTLINELGAMTQCRLGLANSINSMLGSFVVLCMYIVYEIFRHAFSLGRRIAR